MSQFFAVHPETPQVRLINQAVAIIQGGGGSGLSHRLGLCAGVPTGQ